ncbi:MAG: hypothetical protein IIX15_02385, partial [Clostridia bacterium]|nr:hypothetical protein [Clostridia bacterium]
MVEHLGPRSRCERIASSLCEARAFSSRDILFELALATEKEFYRLVAEEHAVNAESGADFDESRRTQVFKVGEQFAAIVRNEGEDGAVSYNFGLGESLKEMQIAQGVSAEQVRALMDRMIGAESAAKQQTADDLTNVQGAAPSTMAGGMTEGAAGASPRPTTANIGTNGATARAATGAAMGQGVALADGATNGQGTEQNATEGEKTGSARTKDIRAEHGRQYEAVKRKARHSVEEARTMQFSEKAVTIALWEAMDHHDAGRDNLILVSKMPQYIVDLLGIEGDFYIYRNHAYENMVSREDAVADGRPVTRHGNDIHFHDLGIEKMTEAILSIEHPTLTIAERGKDGNP